MPDEADVAEESNRPEEHEEKLSEEEKEDLIREERAKWDQERQEKEEERERIEEEMQAKEQEKEEEHKKWEKEYKKSETGEKRGSLKKKLGIAAVIVIVIVAAGVLTFNLNPNLPATSNSFPYTTTYDVLLPQGQSVNFAGTYITAAGTGERVIVTVGGGQGEDMAIGQIRTFSQPRRVIAKIFGITLVDTDYKIDAEFRGYIPGEGKNDFYMSFKTSKQVPQYLIDMLMPREVNARPV